MKRVVVVGASGSIGRQTLEVARARRDRIRVVGLAALRDDAFLVEAARAFDVAALAFADAEAARRAEARLRSLGQGDVRVEGGPGAVARLAAWPEADLVVSAAWGAAGLEATLAALEAGHDVALANKESLVVGGELVVRLARARGARLLPVDSEHSAAFQLWQGRAHEIRRLWLTASGGPFHGRPRQELEQARPAEALRHPTWRMGARITVDSATLFNKGLEVIEAHWLFGLPYEAIEVVVHPESRVHAIAELKDGSFLAHVGPPDMRLPIQYALSWPERWEPAVEPEPPTGWGALRFQPVDREAFPALDLCYEAGRRGGTAPAALNAAKEEAVLAFLAGRIPLGEVVRTAEEALRRVAWRPATREALLLADAEARALARERIARCEGYARGEEGARP